MKGAKKHTTTIVLLALLMLALGTTTESAVAQVGYNCLPTCEQTDGRFFALAGTQLSTFVDDSIDIEFAAPAGMSVLEIGIFDGDTSGTWDYSTTASQYSLYADPDGDGEGDVLLNQWMGGAMPDNDWFTINVSTGPAAKAPSGNYFYTLHITNTGMSSVSLNSFKVRSTGVVTMKPQPIPFVAPLLSQADIEVIYAKYPNSTYSGSWRFHLYVATTSDVFEMWDGDLDFGSYDGAKKDSDDPDTPNDVLPPWAVGTSATYEGVAVGINGSTGAPPDDTDFDLYRRSPSVIYEVVDPDGNKYDNRNPSGDMEWEQFLITSNTGVAADYYVDGYMPAGRYKLNVVGMDMTNLNAWHFPYDLVCQDAGGAACTPLFPYLVGDTVWEDFNGDGVHDEGETGIGGVVVHLLDQHGEFVASTTTNSSGKYRFYVDPGVYTVQIAASNFLSGGVLHDMTSTTGGEEQSGAIVDANELDLDFGYQGPPPSNPGVAPPSYWKNNPSAWPVDQITIGGRTLSKSEAIQLLDADGSTDKRIAMAKQLIAAKLNVLIGNDDSCIAATIAAADDWLAEQGFSADGVVLAGSQAWQEGEPLFNELKDYNNGLLCAPSM